jgi:nucleoside-diphosphate-sugar epimerase
LYTSSTCVYPEHSQSETNCVPLKEEDAYPAAPQDAYGWANLLAERLCIHYRQDYGLETRIVRLPDVFGPVGPWHGGREQAPAALCRKIAAAQLEGLNEIEICGDGEQTVSFCYIDDCITGLHKLMRSDYSKPLNLGQDQMVSVNELADIIAKIAGVQVSKTHVPGSQGVRGRNTDNTRVKEALRWEPQISLEEGLRRTYLWVEKQVRELASEYSFGVATFPLRPGNKEPHQF